MEHFSLFKSPILPIRHLTILSKVWAGSEGSGSRSCLRKEPEKWAKCPQPPLWVGAATWQPCSKPIPNEVCQIKSQFRTRLPGAHPLPVIRPHLHRDIYSPWWISIIYIGWDIGREHSGFEKCFLLSSVLFSMSLRQMPRQGSCPADVFIHWPLGYGPSVLPLHHCSALIWCCQKHFLILGAWKILHGSNFGLWEFFFNSKNINNWVLRAWLFLFHESSTITLSDVTWCLVS